MKKRCGFWVRKVEFRTAGGFIWKERFGETIGWHS